MTIYTKKLSELNEHSLPEAGGKGTNLGVLIQANLPVPTGFVVTTEAYRAHLKMAGLRERITVRLANLQATDLDAIQVASRDICSWIEQASMPEEVQKNLEKAFTQLTLNMGATNLGVAVRSSATAEDLPSASFAGQHETYLGVYGIESIRNHVKKCWASLWSPQAIAYRMSMNFSHHEVDLAVVIQAMVPSEAAGVMFTANPVNGKRDEILISASYGLGESVVSGLVTPDTFIVTKDGKVQERTLGSKEQQIRLTKEGSVTETVAPEERTSYCLGEQELAQLTQLAKFVEEYYDSPMDTEWACEQGHVYLLQARPITTLSASAEDLNVLGPDDEIVYKGKKAPFAFESIVEHSPYPHTPLDFASFQYFYGGINQSLVEVGFKVKGEISPYERESGCIALNYEGLEFPKQFSEPKKNNNTWTKYEAEVQAWVKHMNAETSNTSDPNQLVKLFKQALKDYQNFVYKRFSVIDQIPESVEEKIDAYIIKATGKSDVIELKDLLMRALPFRTALQNQALLKVAYAAAVHGRSSKEFAKEMSLLLQEYGDRPALGMGRMISPATWSEQPNKLDDVIDALVVDDAIGDPEVSFNNQEVEFQAAKQLVKAGLSSVEYEEFTQLLDKVRNAIIIREESVFYLEKIAGCLHLIARRIGDLLVKQGTLVLTDDVFFILLDELQDVINGQLDIEERIEKRKLAFAKVYAAHDQGIHWMISTGSFPVFEKEKKKSEEVMDANMIKGSAASRGVYEGKVCIVKSPSEFKKLKKGDILVSPYTAPIWTPLFKIAGAAITEIGSATSHAAIVAREYGIPAIVAIENITNVLKDGQSIRVDGTNGVITLLA
ncbi:pyruvate, phosphate dikinase [Bacillus thuringiensis serovar londrina]|uniref:PEP/pyruvate-binding domain-containing protein n=1 Tax=Bacillus thuringiensis TaxID=1428 RepID=UPI000B4467A2|nr:PEP/pyruvate-binding domain-containing protein [Bacillus thuringiensis]OTX82280.1 pyruvate, phosphate dikinase [Bacillus thuringiensis serovar londrina]